MKRMLKQLLLITMLLAGLCAQAYAEEADFEPIAFALPVDGGTVRVYTELLEDTHWLFLPAFARLDTLTVDGCELEWWDS